MNTFRKSDTQPEQSAQEPPMQFEHGRYTSSQTPRLARKGDYMTVRDIMSFPVITVGSQTTLPELRDVLVENGFRHILVEEHKQVIGVITDRDIRGALPSDATTLAKWEIPYLLVDTTAKELMRSPVITVLEDAPIQYAARVMLEESISCLPVLYDDRLKGIVISSDILRAVAKS